MADILLTTINARYSHASLGLRYLLANLGRLQSNAEILEFEIKQRAADIVETILLRTPRVVGLGVYVWNAFIACEVARMLKTVAPFVTLVLGGPEVSHETDEQEIASYADYIVTGEADIEFRLLCEQLLVGETPVEKIIAASVPDLASVTFPYGLYTDVDIAQRVIYVEASRGCPYSCEFCLSSLDVPVRQFPLEAFLRDLDLLLVRGARQLKFVDRTFNLVESSSARILECCLKHARRGCFFHFEFVPDRFPEKLRELVRQFPAGTLQLEVGVQTFNSDAAARISRRQNYNNMEENMRFLASETHAHVHADLIVGLPGEDLESFASGFDRLLSLKPQEIQVGILKRLRGAPIARHTAEFQMTYSPVAPYEVLQTSCIPFLEMQRMRRFARYWDLVSNSGNFRETAPLLLYSKGGSAFHEFASLSDWLWAKLGRTDAVALNALAEALFVYLTSMLGVSFQSAAEALLRDFERLGRLERPEFMRKALPAERLVVKRRSAGSGTKRQVRHLADSV